MAQEEKDSSSPPEVAAIYDGLTACVDVAHQIEIEQVRLAGTWALAVDTRKTPVIVEYPEIGQASVWDSLAGIGLPAIDESQLPVLAARAGMTENRAHDLVLAALLLLYVFPRTWGQVLAGNVNLVNAKQLVIEAWYAGLKIKALDYIDQHMAVSTLRIGPKAREGIISEAKLRFMPEVVEAETKAALNRRDVQVVHGHETPGLSEAYLRLDTPDAVDFLAAIQHGAQVLKDNGCEEPLNVRMAYATGDLARASQTPSLAPLSEQEAGRPVWDGKGTPTSKTMLHVFMTDEALFDDNAVVRVEGPGIPSPMLVNAARFRNWFTRDTTCTAPQVRVLPIFNMEEFYRTDSYEVTDRLRTLTELRDGGCVWGFCERRARFCDCDHIQPYEVNEAGELVGGATCACQIASLCRKHHRLKTHSQNGGAAKGKHNVWTYDSLGGGDYVWTGPNGIRLLRTNHGTFDYSDNRSSNGARPEGYEFAIVVSGKLSAKVDDAHKLLWEQKIEQDAIDALALKAKTTTRILERAEKRAGQLDRVEELALAATGEALNSGLRPLFAMSGARDTDDNRWERASGPAEYAQTLNAAISSGALPEDDPDRADYLARFDGPPPF